MVYLRLVFLGKCKDYIGGGMRFFNREKEIAEILHVLNKEPDDIYFIYGSINSGNTA